MNSAEIAQYFSRSKKKNENFVRVSRPFLYTRKKNQLMRARRPIIHLYSHIFLK